MKLSLYITLFLFLVIACSENNIDYLSKGETILENNNDKIDKVELSKAIEYFNLELKKNPDSFKAQFLLAKAYGRMSEVDKSINIFDELIKKNENKISQLLIGRGIEKFIKKDYFGSIEDFNKALSYNKDELQVYKLIVTSKMWQKFNSNGTWLEFEKEDIAIIIDEVYPSNISKPTVDEIIEERGV